MPDVVLSQHSAIPRTANPSYPEGTRADVLMDPTTGALKNYLVNSVTSSDSIADGADVAEGATTDAAVVGDVNGTISAKLRGLNKILNSVWSSGNSWLQVSIQNAILPIIQGLGRSTLPSVGSSGSTINILSDRYGRLYLVSPITSVSSSAGTPITTNVNTQIVGAPASAHHLRIYRLWAQNSSATGTWCYWGNGSGVKSIPFFLGQNQPFSMAINGAWELTTATGLFLNTATTGASIEWYVEYETLDD